VGPPASLQPHTRAAEEEEEVVVIPVRLVWSETLHGAMMGVLRNMNAIYGRLPERHGCEGLDNWTGHIEGACAEVGGGKALGRYWNLDINAFSTGDDVAGFQVRRADPDERLIIRPADADSKRFILVTGTVPNFEVHGVIRAGEAKEHPEWRFAPNGRPPAWFVPSGSLEPIEAYL
jgi:hypothetical protein